MSDLSRYFDSCGECRLEIGGPNKYRFLTETEILRVSSALDAEGADRGTYQMLYEEKCEMIDDLLDTIRTIYAISGENQDVADLCNKRLEDIRFGA